MEAPPLERYASSEVDGERRAYALIDAFDAMTGYRVYRHPVPRLDAVREIESLSGLQFDPELAASFLGMIRISGDLS
jgi:response regulator RpfG family c-di-GMP phosphodiesterase